MRASTSRSLFHSLVLELRFFKAERRTDISKEEGSSLRTTMKPSLSIYSTTPWWAGSVSYPFKDSFVAGLALVAMICTYDLIGSAHAAPSVSVQLQLVRK